MLTLTGDTYNYAAPARDCLAGQHQEILSNTPVSRLFDGCQFGSGILFGRPECELRRQRSGMHAIGSVLNLTGIDNTSMAYARYALVRCKERFRDRQPRIERHEQRSGGHRAGPAMGLDGAEVFDRGVASFDGANEVNILHLVLAGSLGETVSQQYNVFNLLQTAGFTGKLDLLGFSGAGDTAQIDSGLACFLDLEAGDFTPFTATLNTSTLGSYSVDFTLDLVDSASDGIGGGAEHQTLHLQITGEVVPEPSTLVLLTAGLIGLLCFAWRVAGCDRSKL